MYKYQKQLYRPTITYCATFCFGLVAFVDIVLLCGTADWTRSHKSCKWDHPGQQCQGTVDWNNTCRTMRKRDMNRGPEGDSVGDLCQILVYVSVFIRLWSTQKWILFKINKKQHEGLEIDILMKISFEWCDFPNYCYIKEDSSSWPQKKVGPHANTRIILIPCMQKVHLRVFPLTKSKRNSKRSNVVTDMALSDVITVRYCHATEPGFAGDNGAIEIWLIDFSSQELNNGRIECS